MEHIVVYPNPCKESINIKTGSEHGFTLVITDLLGKLVYLQTFPDKQSTVNLSQIPNGTYIFKVNSQGKTIERKIIKI